MQFTYEKQKKASHNFLGGADTFHFLFEDESEVTFDVGWGPGYWYRVVSQLRKAGKDVDPSAFGTVVERLYYYYSPDELVGDQEKQERVGFFTCAKCGVVASKYGAEHDCRWYLG